MKQDPEILKLRIEIMMKENCEEFALNLCTWSLKHPQLKNDLKIKEHQIVIMYKQQMFAKMQEVVSFLLLSRISTTDMEMMTKYFDSLFS